MSKIAEKKAEERFPLHKIDNGSIEAYYNAGQLNHRRVYVEAYDQAMKDFFESEAKYITDILGTDNAIEQFKNYMQDET